MTKGMNNDMQVENLRRKMEGLSKGKLLKRMEEEYGFMLSASANYSTTSSASTSKRYDLADSSSNSFQQSSQARSFSAYTILFYTLCVIRIPLHLKCPCWILKL